MVGEEREGGGVGGLKNRNGEFKKRERKEEECYRGLGGNEGGLRGSGDREGLTLSRQTTQTSTHTYTHMHTCTQSSGRLVHRQKKKQG